jgi:hypothetical protein
LNEVGYEFEYWQPKSSHLSKLLKYTFPVQFRLASHCLKENGKLQLDFAQENLKYSSLPVYMSYQFDLRGFLMPVIPIDADSAHAYNPSHLFSSSLSECWV